MKKLLLSLGLLLGVLGLSAQTIPASPGIFSASGGSGSGGSGTVTSVSVTTANGVSGSVATATTTPAITLTLGAIAPTSVASSGAVSGTTGSFTGHFTVEGVTSTGATGTGKFVFDTSPTFASPTFTGTLTGGGASAATVDYPNAGDTNYTSSGGGIIIFAQGLRFNGAIKDSTGAAGSSGDSLVSTGTAVTWRGTRAVPLVWICAPTSWTCDTTANFVGGANGYRNLVKFDTSNYTQARISVTVGNTAPVANTLVYARYYTSSSGTFANYLPMSTSSADVVATLPASGNTCTVGSWVDLVAGAKGDIFIICGGVAPSGSTAISPQNITVQFR